LEKASGQPALTRIGRFYITRELGRGSIGCVYLAHDPVIGRDVALKTLHAQLSGAERNRRTTLLINEARAVGRLNHPHIVTIHDASGEGNTPFIAMEYLQGRELDRILAGAQRFKPEDAASIGWKLADALDHAHKLKVVHRDVKPSNIFVVGDNQPKLMDFGIARAPNRMGEWDESEHSDYTMFRPNSALGTPYYMSPEQAQGKPADERSDIYALGVVLYEMLAGRKPFEEKDPDRLLHQIAFKAPASLSEVAPEVPPILAQIVMKAISKRPEKRYQNGQQMALDLKRYLLRERSERRRRNAPAEESGAETPTRDARPSASTAAPAPSVSRTARWPLLVSVTLVAAAAIFFTL
ncbi:MAG TPA: serine/threonine-protein kinase, partial [Noviherbaspirillum sp.]